MILDYIFHYKMDIEWFPKIVFARVGKIEGQCKLADAGSPEEALRIAIQELKIKLDKNQKKETFQVD